nr:Chain P, RECOGNITION PEPTIDE [synthetic construct]
APKTNMKHMA